jgi:hypothetical protein
MRIRHTLYIAAILVSGCTIQDVFTACQNEGQRLCVIDETSGEVREQLCKNGNLEYHVCKNGCDTEIGACVTDDRACEAGTKDVCAGPRSQIRCVELEGQYADGTDLNLVPRYYVKREVPCPGDGVCNFASQRCDSRSEVNDNCNEKKDYCISNDNGEDTIRQYCSGGVYYSQDCAIDGLVCKSGRCVKPAVCDPIIDDPKCENERTLSICDEYGQWVPRTCNENTECIKGACVTMFQPGSPCKSASFVEYCSEDGWYRCIDDVVTVTNCLEEDAICEDPDYKDKGAGCYPECETVGMISGRLSCMSNNGMLTYQACIQTTSGRNVRVDEEVTNTCFGNSYTICADNHVSMRYCAGGCRTSASMGYNAQCLSIEMVPSCTSETVLGCRDLRTKYMCNPSSLVPEEVACEANQRCSMGECVDADAPAVAGEFCDPEATVSHCMDDTVLLRCNSEVGLYEYVNCSEYIINYYQSYDDKPVTGTCHEVKDDTGNTTTGTCGVPCGGSTCYTDQVYNGSCLNGKFIHMTKVLDVDNRSINRITEMVSRCNGKRMYHCIGNELKNDPCPNSCTPETFLTAKCE